MLSQMIPDVIFKGDFDTVRFALKLARKDIGLATELAREFDVPMPMAADRRADHGGGARPRLGRQGLDCRPGCCRRKRPASRCGRRPVEPAALDGVRVLELARFQAGPRGGMLLSDLGAEVIKIEPPGGEETRRHPPMVRGQSVYFSVYNRGKKSICLDLRSAAGQGGLRRAGAEGRHRAGELPPRRDGARWASTTSGCAR